jgi:hypothetical protein
MDTSRCRGGIVRERARLRHHRAAHIPRHADLDQMIERIVRVAGQQHSLRRTGDGVRRRRIRRRRNRVGRRVGLQHRRQVAERIAEVLFPLPRRIDHGRHIALVTVLRLAGPIRQHDARRPAQGIVSVSGVDRIASRRIRLRLLHHLPLRRAGARPVYRVHLRKHRDVHSRLHAGYPPQPVQQLLRPT